MGLTRLAGFRSRHKRIALNTSVFIYQPEGNTRYVPLERPHHAAVTSTITMTEPLALPYRDSDEQRVNEFYSLLSTYPNLEWIAPSLEIADIAARIRATHRLRTPDALQAATAVWAKATGFVTNDNVFQRVSDFETLVLEELLAAPAPG